MSLLPMRIREPVVAGRFYERDPQKLLAQVQRLCLPLPHAPPPMPEHLVGALVPHAGYVCSGRLAGVGLSTLASRSRPVTVVLTGSVHTMDLRHPALDAADAWATPLGRVEVDHALREAMAGLDQFAILDAAHLDEHSLEVELPLMQVTLPGVRIVPVMIPPAASALRWGEAVGELLETWPQEVVMVCSVDLTHYGPSYRFTPHGSGDTGRRWAHEVNDRRLLRLIEHLDAAAVLADAAEHQSTCGAGAIAATLTCCRRLGASRGFVLDHSDSARELAPLGYTERENSVGYAAVVFG